MQCKCHTYCLWWDQQPAHQRLTLILITCLLLWPLPAVTQKLPHIWRTKKQKKKKEEEMTGLMEMTEKPETKKKRDNAAMTHFIDWASSFIAPACRWMLRICVHLSHGKQKRRKRRQRSADERYERAEETVAAGTGELARTMLGWGMEPTAVGTAWKKKKSTAAEITCWARGFLLGCILTLRWHWSAYSHGRASALAVHRIRFHFTVPELATHSACSEESSRQHWMCVHV